MVLTPLSLLLYEYLWNLHKVRIAGCSATVIPTVRVWWWTSRFDVMHLDMWILYVSGCCKTQHAQTQHTQTGNVSLLYKKTIYWPHIWRPYVGAILNITVPPLHTCQSPIQPTFITLHGPIMSNCIVSIQCLRYIMSKPWQIIKATLGPHTHTISHTVTHSHALTIDNWGAIKMQGFPQHLSVSVYPYRLYNT